MSSSSSLRFSVLPLFLLALGPRSTDIYTAPQPHSPRAAAFGWSGGDTPIKVGGGSMTFHSKQKWAAENTVSVSDCTSIAYAPSYDLVFHDIQDSSTPLTGRWTVTFFNAHLKNPRNPGKEGVTMTVDPAHGCNGEAKLEAVTITTFHKNQLSGGHVNFYGPGGLPAGGYISSRRFHNDARHAEYNCSLDRDTCERMAFVSINGAPAIACTTADCTVLVKIPD